MRKDDLYNIITTIFIFLIFIGGIYWLYYVYNNIWTILTWLLLPCFLLMCSIIYVIIVYKIEYLINGE